MHRKYSIPKQAKKTSVDYKIIKDQLSGGSRKAYETLYKFLYRDLCNYAYNIIPDADIVEDIVQATFMNLWENRHTIESIEYLKSYLYKCVYNACLKKLKHDKVVGKFQNEHEYQLKQIQFETFECSYDEAILDELNKAIEQLPDKNREVMKLRFIDGLSTNEVSQQLDISPRTVETHVSKALRFLREKLSGTAFLFLFFQF